MATTKPDIVISGDTWVEAHTVSSIPTSSFIIIQNKGNTDLLVNYNTQPLQSSTEGFLLTKGQALRTQNDTVWIKSIFTSGTVYIEEDV